jgi:hypothetical protein
VTVGRSQCCTRGSCLQQARDLADEMTLVSVQIAMREEITIGSTRPRDLVGNPFFYSRPDPNDVSLPEAQRVGRGLVCGHWAQLMEGTVRTTLRPYRQSGSLCFESDMRHRPGHDWVELTAPSGTIMTVDPWQSGGLTVIP